MKMMAPIPGMSLTREPGNAPWEQPPMFDLPEQALAFYLDKFEDEDRLDDLLFAMEAGYPVDAMVDFLTSYGVMEGYHSFDVKMLISPLLHEYIISLCEAADVPFTEKLGPTKEERISERDKKRSKALLMKTLADPDATPSDTAVEKAEDMMEGEGGASSEEEEPSPSLIKRRM